MSLGAIVIILTAHATAGLMGWIVADAIIHRD